MPGLEPDRTHASWTSAIADLGEADRPMRASAAVEERLLGEVRAIGAARRRRTMIVWGGALAALIPLVFVIWIPKRSTTAPTTQVAVSTPAAPAADPGRPVLDSRAAAGPDAMTGFVPLVYSQVPSASRQVIRMHVPRSAIAQFGLASSDRLATVSSDRILVDVIVGEDGLARAVRFVQPVLF